MSKPQIQVFKFQSKTNTVTFYDNISQDLMEVEGLTFEQAQKVAVFINRVRMFSWRRAEDRIIEEVTALLLKAKAKIPSD